MRRSDFYERYDGWQESTQYCRLDLTVSNIEQSDIKDEENKYISIEG
ncbi:MAG: hypothetical protein ACOYBH_04050 [Candidatus Alectryocaccobium sp.]